MMYCKDAADINAQAARHDTQPIGVSYRDLPGDMPAAVRAILPTYGAFDSVTDVFKPDAETVEIVFYGDVDAKRASDGYGGTTWEVSGSEVSDDVATQLIETIRTYWGAGWMLFRKGDERESRGRSRQRFLLRRAEYTTFRYSTESKADARKIAAGLDTDADVFGDLPEYPRPPDPISNFTTGGDADSPPCRKPLDVYVHRTSTGTAHLIKGGALRGASVAEDVPCLCGRHVDAEAVRDGEVFHLADYVQRFEDLYFDPSGDRVRDVDNYRPASAEPNTGPHPVQLFMGDLCGSCMKDYLDVGRSALSRDIVGYELATSKYDRLRNWSVRDGELDWEPARPSGGDDE